MVDKKANRSVYFSRFQVKFRRRREGKTDYYSRKKLITQDKNKYDTPKYRLVVRFTNKRVICQVVYSKIQGDIVVESAYSTELKKYGLNVGLKNYAAAYCTGLLIARRTLKKMGMDSMFEGNKNINGEAYIAESTKEGKDAFRVYLDSGLRMITTGSRLFAALKGAVDGGLDVPHSESRFVGYDKESKTLDTSVLNGYIHGSHVGDNMARLLEEDENECKKRYGNYMKDGVTPDSLEGLYKNVHDLIFKDPSREPSKMTPEKLKSIIEKSKSLKTKRLTSEERRARANAALENALKKLNGQQA